MKPLMPMLVIALLVLGIIAPVATEAQTDRPAIVAFCKSVKGKNFYLKIDVVSIERPREGTEAAPLSPCYQYIPRSRSFLSIDIRRETDTDF